MATTTVYNIAKYLLSEAGIDFSNDDIRVLLVNSSVTVDADHVYVDDVVPTPGASPELSGTGYSRQSLANSMRTNDLVNDRTVFDADDMVWAGANFGTPDAALLYRFVTSDADSPLVAIINLSPKNPTNGATFTINWHATLGILKFV